MWRKPVELEVNVETITSAIPDVEVFLSLATEDLAETILRIAFQSKQQSGLIHPQTLLSQLDGHPSGSSGYPISKRSEAEQAFSEAWNWLTVQGLLIPDAGMNGNNGWMRFGRRAQSLLEKNNFKNYAHAITISRTLIHATIASEVWNDLARGDLPTAVFKSFKAVEIAVRDAGKFSANDIGVPLMRKAFDKSSGPLSDMSQPEGEREALANLFVGAIGSYKNPHSHRTVTINDPTEAQEMVIFASHLLRIVDSRRKANP